MTDFKWFNFNLSKITQLSISYFAINSHHLELKYFLFRNQILLFLLIFKFESI